MKDTIWWMKGAYVYKNLVKLQESKYPYPEFSKQDYPEFFKDSSKKDDKQCACAWEQVWAEREGLA